MQGNVSAQDQDQGSLCCLLMDESIIPFTKYLQSLFRENTATEKFPDIQIPD